MSKAAKTILGVVVILVLVGLVWLAAGKKENAVLSSEPIKIGAILPMTGAVQYLGILEKKGLDLAAKEINLAGGIRGRKIEMVYEDSRGDTKEGVSAYQKLTQVEGLDILLTTESATTLALAPLAKENGVLIFSIAGADSKISSAGDNIFRHNLLPREEIPVVVDILQKMKPKKLGAIALNTDSGLSYVKELEGASAQGKMPKISAEYYEKGNKDFRTQLTKLKGAEADTIFVFGHAKDVGLIIKQGQELGMGDKQWVGTFGTEGNELVDALGGFNPKIVYTHFFDDSSLDPVYVTYKNKFFAEYKETPEAFGSLAYDNLNMISHAIKTNCPTTIDYVCVKEGLYTIKDFQGVTGRITIDSNGDTGKDIIIKTLNNGNFVKLK